MLIPSRVKSICLMLFCFSFFITGKCQTKDCRDCNVESFQSVTMYYIAQPHSSFGFGLEGGKWNKTDSRFSYFLGARMQWFILDPNSAKFNNAASNVRFSFYMKGQARILDRLYAELSPTFVNLNSFDTGLGLRYSYPLNEVIGIGVEPTYMVVQKEYSMNVNIHFAL